MSGSSLSLLAGILAVAFALVAGALGVYASRAKDGIPYGKPSVLPGRKVRADQKTWDEVHRKAAPLLWTSSAIAGIQALALAVGVLNPQLLSLGYILTLTGVGAVLILALLYLAGRP